MDLFSLKKTNEDLIVFFNYLMREGRKKGVRPFLKVSNEKDESKQAVFGICGKCLVARVLKGWSL